MADPFVAERTKGASADAAAGAIERFCGASREIRGCALLGPDRVLAASSSDDGWEEGVRALLDAADAAAGTEASHAHVATEEGEVFVVRADGLAMVAVTSRYTLASLVFADMRAALRDARTGGATASEAS